MTARLISALFVTAAAVVAAAGGCANSTGGDLVALPFHAGGVIRDVSQPLAFATPTGWTVSLDHALIAAGPFYFNVLPPSTDEFRSGVVIIQATEQVIIDALDPTLHDVAGGANGETGSAVSVEIDLFAPDAPDQAANPDAAALIDTGFAYASGTATSADGATMIPFAGIVAIDPSLVTPSEPLADLGRIRGASAALAFTATPQVLELRVDPTHWFDQCDFAPLAATGGSWTVATTFATQLREGVKSETGVYAFDLTTADPQ